MTGKETVVLDPQGYRQVVFPEPEAGWEITWNQQSNLLASLTDLNDEVTVLRYWPFGTQHFAVVDTIGRENKQASPTTISWSPGGAAITYSKAGEICIFTLANGKTVSIGKGTMPTWSPDGNWIAYRDRAGHVVIVSPRDHNRRVIMPETQVRRGLRWSPDSAFLLTTTLRPHRSFYEETEFVIYRMGDGKSIRWEPLIGGTDEERVFWVKKPPAARNK
jgi:hypothetical protein